MRRLSRLILSLFLSLTAVSALAQSDFGIDPRSPEVPARSPSDILDSNGANVVVTAQTLGLPPTANVDAFSYGVDQIKPLGPNFYVTILYSVDRNTVGLQAGPQPGTGAVWRQSTGNGAAGDKFFLKARLAPPPVGMFPISRGLNSDAPMQNLTPKGTGTESELDGLSFRVGPAPKTVYFSVDPAGVPGQNWGPSDIIRVDIDPATGAATPPRVWATAAQLGLQAGDDIDALAIQNRGNDDLNQGDVVYVSLRRGSPTRQSVSLGQEAVLQVYPGAPQVVFNASILNLTNAQSEELDALTGIDPGPPRKKPREKKTQ